MAHVRTKNDKWHRHTEREASKFVTAVNKVKIAIQETIINPFTCESEHLLSISTGLKAESCDIIHAREKGLVALQGTYS